MEQENQQQINLDEALVPRDDQVKIGACNFRIAPEKKQKEPTYKLTLDILKYLIGKKKTEVDVQTEKKKDTVPRTKRSFTAADNILSDPDEAVKLVESISLIEAEEQEEE
ncbi:hypothetical protein Tco_0246797 [Tanacetum coccineum]